MLKLNSLRSLLLSCLPNEMRDPERLKVIGENGRILSTGTRSLSFEYQYTAFVRVLDYSGHADAIIVPVIAWLQRNQYEQMQNPALREKAIQFRVEPLTPQTFDIGIWLQLTETVCVSKDPAAPSKQPNRLRVEHMDEPVPEAFVDEQERWELWFRDEKMLAQWDFSPPPAFADFKK